MKILGVIPSRYASTRFPGKPLAIINGKSMIRRVYEQASKSALLSHVVVATDDKRIADEVDSFGGKFVMTSEKHQNGTMRCLEALQKSEDNFDAVINIQGDEPYIKPEQIDYLAKLVSRKDVDIATLATKISHWQNVFNPNVVKLVFGSKNSVLYFSRSPIPYFRDTEKEQWINNAEYFKHLGIYAYKSDVLEEICSLKPGVLEQIEKLEQLRWLENGFSIFAEKTEFETIGIDTPEDLEKLINII